MIRLLFVLLLLLSAGCAFQSIDTAEMLASMPEPVTYDPPEPERWEVNGIEIVYLENKELPLVGATLYFRHGALHVPEFTPAVVSVAGGQMRAGGAGKWTADQLDEELEELSAGVSSSLGDEYGSVSVGGLISDREQLFEMFSAVVREPRFEEARLSLWKGKSLESIRRRGEDPYTIASLSFRELMYPDTPYGFVLDSPTVKSISRADLLRVHRALVRPESAVMTVTGALSKSEVNRLVEEYFGDWKVGSRSFTAIPEVETEPKPGVYLIEMPFEQSTFIMGQLGVPRLSPMHIPIIAFNEVFGSGGFSARLFKRVRVELGLAYSAYGAVMPDVSRGRNVITAQTKAESTVAAIEASLTELSKMQQELVSDYELSETQRAIENSFVFKFASPESLVSRYAVLDLLDYPADYDRTFIEKVNAVEAEDIQRVASFLWDPADFVVVIVGNKRACSDFETAFKDPSFPLHGLPLKRVKFDERLQLAGSES